MGRANTTRKDASSCFYIDHNYRVQLPPGISLRLGQEIYWGLRNGQIIASLHPLPFSAPKWISISEVDVSNLWLEIRRSAIHAIKLYFAPLTGAIRGIRHEYRRLDRESRMAHRGDANKH